VPLVADVSPAVSEAEDQDLTKEAEEEDSFCSESFCSESCDDPDNSSSEGKSPKAADMDACSPAGTSLAAASTAPPPTGDTVPPAAGVESVTSSISTPPSPSSAVASHEASGAVAPANSGIAARSLTVADSPALAIQEGSFPTAGVNKEPLVMSAADALAFDMTAVKMQVWQALVTSAACGQLVSQLDIVLASPKAQQPISRSSPGSPVAVDIKSEPGSGFSAAHTPVCEAVFDDDPVAEARRRVVAAMAERTPELPAPPTNPPWWRCCKTPEETVPAPRPLNWGHCLGPSSAQEIEDVLKNPVIQPPSPHLPSKVEVLRALMRSHGDGNIGVAWRRYFDKNGTSEVNFQDFCAALSSLGSEVDALDLWHTLDPKGARDKAARHLGLRLFDRRTANLILEFGQWCHRCSGGPLGVFAAADLKGTGTLTPKELVAGIRWLGFFDEVGRSEDLRCESAFLEHMYPLIDPWRKGRVAGDHLLFLEQDPSKKRRLIRKATGMKLPSPRAANKEPPPPKVQAPVSASHMLHNLSKRGVCRIGKNFDAYLQPVSEEVKQALARHPPKQKPKPVRRKPFAQRHSASTPELSSVPPASQHAADTAAAVLAVSAQAFSRDSVSLPRLPGAARQLPNASVAGSRCGREVAGSEASFQYSVAASSVAANRQHTRRLYRAKLSDRLPALAPPLHDRDLQSVLTGADCHRRQMDMPMNPKGCEGFMSQNYERALFERYYG